MAPLPRARARARASRVTCLRAPFSHCVPTRALSLLELDEVLGVGLRVVVRDEDGGRAHVVDCRVVQLVAAAGAHVGNERVLLALAVLADGDAAEEHVLHALGVGSRVLRGG